MAGFTGSFGGSRACVLKYSSSGTLLWQKTWTGGSGEYAWAVSADGSGNIYVAGNTETFSAGAYDVFLLKYSSAGDLLWQKTWGGAEDDEPFALSLDGSGNIYVTGRTESFGTGDTDVFLLKYSPSGDLLTQRTWGGSSDERARFLFAGGSGMLYLAGGAANVYGSWSTPIGTTNAPSGTEGTPIGTETTPSGTEGTPTGIETFPAGVEDDGGGGGDALVMKIDPSGW